MDIHIDEKDIHRITGTSGAPGIGYGGGADPDDGFAGHVSGDIPDSISLDYGQSVRLFSGEIQSDPAFVAWCETHAEGLTGPRNTAIRLTLSEWLKGDVWIAWAFRGGRAYQAQHPDETED